MNLMAGVYKHYKGGYYQALGIGAHSETGEQMVVYISVRPAGFIHLPPLPGPRIRLRPVALWEDLVTWTDGSTFRHQSEEGIPAHRTWPIANLEKTTLGPRFKYVGLEIPIEDVIFSA